MSAQDQQDVRAMVAARGWERSIEAVASAAVALGYRHWWNVQQDLDHPELIGLHGPELTKALLRGTS